MNPEDFYAVMAWFGDHDLCESIFWHRRAQEGMRVLINVSDMFWWATADAEPVTAPDLPGLEQAHADLLATDAEDIYTYFAPELWVARKRNMRPQTPWWNRDKCPEPVRELFLAAGPVRDRKDEG